jgi:hypothetical protein
MDTRGWQQQQRQCERYDKRSERCSHTARYERA